MTNTAPPSTRVNGAVTRRADGSLGCSACGGDLPGELDTYLSLVPFHEGPVTDGGPHLFPDPSVYIDQPVVFRQYYCPGCWAALQTDVVPR